MTYLFELASMLDDEEDLTGNYSDNGESGDTAGLTQYEEYEEDEFDKRSGKWKTRKKVREVSDDNPDFQDDEQKGVLDQAWEGGSIDPAEKQVIVPSKDKSKARPQDTAKARIKADRQALGISLRNSLKELIDAYISADQEAGRGIDTSPEAQMLNEHYEHFNQYSGMEVIKAMQAYGLYRNKEGKPLPVGACEPFDISLLSNMYYQGTVGLSKNTTVHDPEPETLERVADQLNRVCCGRSDKAMIGDAKSLFSLINPLAKKDVTTKKMISGEEYVPTEQTAGNTGEKCYFTSGEYIDGIEPIIQAGDKSSAYQAKMKSLEFAQLGSKKFALKYKPAKGQYKGITKILRDDSTLFYPYGGAFYGNTPGPEAKSNMVGLGTNFTRYLHRIVEDPTVQLSNKANPGSTEDYKQKLAGLIDNAVKGKGSMLMVPYETFSEFLDGNMVLTRDGVDHPLFYFWRTATDTRSMTVANPDEEKTVSGQEAVVSAAHERMRDEVSGSDSAATRNDTNLNVVLASNNIGPLFELVGVKLPKPEDGDYTKLVACSEFLAKLSERVKAIGKKLDLDNVPEVRLRGEKPEEGITANASEASHIGYAWRTALVADAGKEGADPLADLVLNGRIPFVAIIKTMVTYVAESENTGTWKSEGMNNPVIHLGMAYASLGMAYESAADESFLNFDEAMTKLACNFIVDMAAENGIDLLQPGLIDEILAQYDRRRRNYMVDLSGAANGKPATPGAAAAIRRRVDKIMSRTPEYRLDKWLAGLASGYEDIEGGDDVISLMSEILGKLPAPTQLPLVEGEDDYVLSSGHTPVVGDAAYLMLLVYLSAIRFNNGDMSTDTDYVSIMSGKGRKSSVRLLDLLNIYGKDAVSPLTDTLAMAAQMDGELAEEFGTMFGSFCKKLFDNDMGVDMGDQEAIKMGRALQNNEFVTFTNARMK